MENYEKAYKEALERAKKELQTCGSTDCDAARQIFRFFPELKESEDEKIRKLLIDIVKVSSCGRVLKDIDKSEYQKCLAWLEKQGGRLEKYNEYDKDMLGAIEYYIKYNRPLKKEHIAWLEKQGGQKPADNPEPKFKVGDWIVYDRNDSSREILYVYDIRDGRYYFNDNIHVSWSIKECDEKSHLWTIQDAKDGDVLAEHETIVLFKKIEGQNIRCYCTYYYLGFNTTFYVGTFQNKNPYYPATKEQRDLLFQKIKEAGYEWDAEKKELKKIEQKPTWSEEDENLYTWCVSAITTRYNDGLFTTSEYKQTRLWLKSLKDRVQPQPKQEWSEKDEKMIDKIIDELTPYGECPDYPSPEEQEYYYTRTLMIDWLKSLKPNHWKPSEEQMEALNALNNTAEISYPEQADLLIDLYNDLKNL